MGDASGDRASATQTKMTMLRLASDLRAMQADPPSGCSASPVSEDNLFLWNATIIGPDDSPWEGAGARRRCVPPAPRHGQTSTALPRRPSPAPPSRRDLPAAASVP